VQHVISAERHVVPLRGGEVGAGETGAPVIGDAPLGIDDVLQHAVQHQDVVRGAALRTQRRPLRLHQRLVRHRQHRAVEPRERDAPGLIRDHVDPQRLIQLEDRPCLDRAWRVVIPRDDDDGRVRQPGPQPVQLLEQEQDRRIGGPDGVEDVARHHDQVGPLHQQVVHGAAERLGDVRLPLIPAARRLPVVLAEPEVEVGEVGELHAISTAPPRSG